MRNLFTIILALFSTVLFAQENTVNIISSGDGKTKDAATNAALRHCIEKTFGVFVNTNTTVVNDELVKDEITNMASGNIVSYEVLSELKENDNYVVTVSAVVSPYNIVNTFKSKGYSFELHGNIYAQNIQKENYYKEQEPKVLTDFLKQFIDYPIFDTFEIKIFDPYLNNEYKTVMDRRLNIRQNLGLTYEDIGMKEKIKNYIPGYLLGGQLFSSIQLFKNEMIHYRFNFRDQNYGSIRYTQDEENERNTTTFGYPIVYTPHFNAENASELSKILKTFFMQISQKDPNYKVKYGELFDAKFLFQYIELDKRGNPKTREESLIFSFRNPESINVINEFAETIGRRSSPNSLILNNTSNTFNRKSYWAYQDYQNATNSIKKLSEFRPNYHLNLANGFPYPFEIRNYKSDIYAYRPVLLYFNVTEKELLSLEKLNFNWNVKDRYRGGEEWDGQKQTNYYFK